MNNKRSGVPLDQSLTKKPNTGKDIPSSNFTYSGVQKLKAQKEELQKKMRLQQQMQQQKSAASASSSQVHQFSSQKPLPSATSSSSQVSYAHLRQKMGASKEQKPTEQTEKSQQSQEQKKTMTQQELSASTSAQILQQRKLQAQMMSQIGAKRLPTSVKSSNSSQQSSSSASKQQSIKINPNLPADQLELLKYAKKKELQKKKMEHLIKKGEIKIEITKKEEEEKFDPKLKDVTLNEDGELRDKQGNLIKIEQHVGSLKINKSKKQHDKLKQLLKNASLQTGIQKFMHDQNLLVTTTKKRDKRKSHALHFIETKGDVVGEEELQKKIQDGSIIERSENDAKQVDYQQQQKRVSIKIKHADPIPNIEWWDKVYLHPNATSYLEKGIVEEEGKSENQNQQEEESQQQQQQQQKLNQLKQQIYDNPEEHLSIIQQLESTSFNGDYYLKEKINNYIEHPAMFKNNQADQSTVTIPVYLTKEERKKIRRRKRKEKEQDKQDRIKLGLLEAPKPKVKLSNMINVYGNEAYIDPSRVEQEVKQQVLQRLADHNKRNQERKLNPEQRKDKFNRKLKRDSQVEKKVALFRIENLSDGQHRYKINANATQMQLNGICLIGDFIQCPSLVLVEGGQRAVKFYKNLMLRRIKWDQVSYNKNENEEEEEEENEEEKNKIEEEIQNGKPEKIKKSKSDLYDLTDNKCHLVWEGTLQNYNFQKWEVLELTSEVEGKKTLAMKGVEYYWDMVQNYKEVE